MVGLAFAVVGIGTSIIYFFWSRYSLETTDNVAESKVINNAESKKEEEIKPQAKKEVTTVLPKSDKIIDSDNLGAAAPADQIRDTNLNGALAPMKDAMASNNNLEEDKMGNFPTKIKKFFCGPSNSEECEEDIKKKEEEMKKLREKKEEFLIKEGKKIIPSNISPISMRSNNDNSNWMDPNDLNNTFDYPNVDKKALNAIGTKVNGIIDKKINDNNKQYDQKLEEVKKDIKDVKEEQINIKAMLANHDKMLAEMKQQTAEIHKTTLEMKEDKKAHDELMAALWNKLDEWNGIKEPTRETNDNRESTNTSLSSFKYKNPFRNNSQIPKMERADMAHSYDENQ